jgi:thioester reductase-like protein
MTDSTPQDVLFTGFPGFIGGRLLPRLIELSPAWRFQCLVQPRFLDLARKSVAEIESRYPAARGRLCLVPGDITQERLGIEEGPARSLQGRLVAAYHLAAAYDLAVPREVGHRVNVEGTRNVLRFLADAPRLDRLHYVSTAYVSGRARGVFRESDLDIGQGFFNHYDETKFLAEVDVVKSGVPRTIYRPGVVVGDSRTGETAKFDGPYFVMTAMDKLPSRGVFLRMGSGRASVNVVPVDFVIDALARLSTQPHTLGKTYHLTDPDPLTVTEFARSMAQAMGKSFVYVRVPMALAKAVFSMPWVERALGIPAEGIPYFDYPCRHDATEATRDLAALGVRCPRVPEYVDRLVAFYRERKGQVRREAMI